MLVKLTYLIIFSCYIPVFATDPPKTIESTPALTDDRGIFYSAENFNLIKNSEFDEKTNHWFLGKYNGAMATFTTDSTCTNLEENCAIIETSGAHDMMYEDIQLFNFLEISKHTSYHISFKASVQQESLISISLSNGIDTFYERKLLLRPDQIEYGPFSFKSDFNETFTYFAINLGRTQCRIALDDISITADNTEKDFNQIIANSGFNIEKNTKARELYISLPTAAKSDYPVIIINHNGQTVKTHKILEGNQEVLLNLQDNIEAGDYLLKIFSPDKTLVYNFRIE